MKIVTQVLFRMPNGSTKKLNCIRIITVANGVNYIPEDIKDLEDFEKAGYSVVKTNSVIQNLHIPFFQSDLVLDKETVFTGEKKNENKPTLQTFPNGFDCWHETHFHIVSAIANTPEDAWNKVTNIEAMQGQGGLWEFAKELTDKFEKKYAGKRWDGEYFDTLGEFIEEEFSNE